jgi:hypothetical protein
MTLSEPRRLPRRSGRNPSRARDIVSRALSESRQHLAYPGTLAALAAAALVCGLTGPFATELIFAPVPRIAFWAVMVFATYAAGAVAADLAWEMLGRRLRPMQALALGAAAPAIATPPVVLGVNLVVLGTPYPFDGLLAFVASLVLVCGAVGTLAHLALRDCPVDWTSLEGVVSVPTGARSAAVTGEDPATRLLGRLPPDVRAPLVAMSGKDHYVEVRTLKGDARLLMRLSDAIREAGSTRGLRVHRSHWVALDRVDGWHRNGPRMALRMATGPDIPVSRGSMTALREAGLVPR